MRGRKPTPTPLKILRGDRAGRINRDEPAPVPGRPECPEHLDAAARRAWDRLVPLLEEAGVLSRADGDALALYCSSYSRWVDAEAKLQKFGAVVKTGLGALKPSPYVGISNQAAGAMQRLLVEFGCTPSSRSRIRVDGKADDDPLAKFLGRRKA